MLKIGLLPASGSATRLNGIPKFLLPVPGGTLLTWHVHQMLEVCDEVRVSTRKAWLPLLETIKLPSKVKVYELEPSTFSDALYKMSSEGRLLIGMPDTYIKGATENIYKKLLESDGDMVLAGLECPTYLYGSVGQFTTDDSGRVLDVKDKEPGCSYPNMWGAVLINQGGINRSFDNPSFQAMDWIEKGKDVTSVKIRGQYIDAGTFDGLNHLYSS